MIPLSGFHALRRGAISPDQVFAISLHRFPNLQPPAQLAAPAQTRVFQPHVSDRVVGSNWVMVGEAAALVDPLSSIGVSAAIRHGTEAAEAIAGGSQAPRLLSRYDQRLRSVATLYNESINEFLYGPRLRRRFGLRQAARSYVILGYLTSALYTRLQPATSAIRNRAMTLVVAMFRAWTRIWLAASNIAR